MCSLHTCCRAPCSNQWCFLFFYRGCTSLSPSCPKGIRSNPASKHMELAGLGYPSFPLGLIKFPWLWHWSPTGVNSCVSVSHGDVSYTAETTLRLLNATAFYGCLSQSRSEMSFSSLSKSETSQQTLLIYTACLCMYSAGNTTWYVHLDTHSPSPIPLIGFSCSQAQVQENRADIQISPEQ